MGERERGSKNLRVEGAEKRQRQTETGGATKRLRQENQEGNKSKIPKPREGGKQVRTERLSRQRMTRKSIKREEESQIGLESGSRLRGWLETYGIGKVRGSEEHVKRLREARDRVTVESNKGFMFTFRKATEAVRQAGTTERDREKSLVKQLGAEGIRGERLIPLWN